ncbi:POK19 protein, partial [Pedionomus torquatus]|nr:POK19 protein [Pedionomus torquatus]
WNVRRHLISCFAVLGVPITIKTHNGPAYSSGPLKRFMQLWNIVHITGIPHSPTGQAIIERANGT